MFLIQCVKDFFASSVLVLSILLFSGIADAQSAAEKDSVHKAGLNYLEGFYEGDNSRLEESLSPALIKYGFWREDGSDEFQDPHKMTYEEAIKFADDVKENKNFPKPDAPKKVEVIDFTNKIAIVKISAWWGVDYMLLTKMGDKWMIGQVVWEGPSLKSAATEEDKTAVKRAGLNYVEGFYEGDASKLRASLHPEMYKFGYGLNKETGEYREGSQMTYERAIAYADRVKEKQDFAKPDAPKKVEVLGVMNKIAAVKITAWWGVDYMLLVKNGDKWMIEQILWASLPE